MFQSYLHMVETLFKDKMKSICFLPPKMGPFQALSVIASAHTRDIIGSSGNRYIFPLFDNLIINVWINMSAPQYRCHEVLKCAVFANYAALTFVS